MTGAAFREYAEQLLGPAALGSGVTDEQREEVRDNVEQDMRAVLEAMAGTHGKLVAVLEKMLRESPLSRPTARSVMTECARGLDAKTLKLDLDAKAAVPFADLLRQEAARALAAATKAPVWRFQQLTVSSGCVAITFRILPGASEHDPCPQELWKELCKQADDEKSALRASWIGQCFLLLSDWTPERKSAYRSLLTFVAHWC
jgi:hypothetical protein